MTLDSDVDGDGRTEISIFRPSENASYAYCTLNNSTLRNELGYWNSQTDSNPFLADLDGDGIADWTFIRTDPASGIMLVIYRSSRSDQTFGSQFGNTNYGDVHVFGDYDGDGRIGVAVFRPSTGNWYILNDIENPGMIRYDYWGTLGDTPCAGDFDGDGKTDLCVVRQEYGQFAWYIRRSSDDQLHRVVWGLVTDTIYPRSPVDIDGDGFTDVLVSRIEDGKRFFYALRSSDNSWFVLQWGLSTDAVRFGDYDKDGKTDFAAIREIDNQLVWFIHQSSDGQTSVEYWGLPGDR